MMIRYIILGDTHCLYFYISKHNQYASIIHFNTRNADA